MLGGFLSRATRTSGVSGHLPKLIRMRLGARLATRWRYSFVKVHIRLSEQRIPLMTHRPTELVLRQPYLPAIPNY